MIGVFANKALERAFGSKANVGTIAYSERFRSCVSMHCSYSFTTFQDITLLVSLLLAVDINSYGCCN